LYTNLKIYGTKTSRFQLTENFIKKFLDKAHVDYQIEEISNIKEYLANDVHSIPAVQIENEPPMPLRSNGGFNQSLREIIQEILERNNYGTLDRFIIPIDFSESSLNAFYYANQLAKYHGEVLILSHVYTSTSTDISQSLVIEPRIQIQRKKQLEDLVKELNKEWVGNIMAANLVTSHFDEGFPGEKVVSLAKEQKAKYIIMSSSGDQNALKRIFGSVSLDIMKNAECPVLIIPPSINFKPIKKILFATENPKEDVACLSQLEEIAQTFDSKITLFHVKKPDSPLIEFDPEWISDYSQIDVNFIQVDGSKPTEAIQEYILNNKADLVVVKPKRRQLLERMFHSSVSKYLSIYADIPILAVR